MGRVTKNSRSSGRSLLAAATLVAGVVLSVIGAALGLAGFLLFKVAPILLVGWIVMKVIDRRRQGSLSAEDRRWLEGD